MFSTTDCAFHRPWDPVPRDPGLRFPSSCVLQHGAGKKFRARFIIYREDRLETNDGHEKYSFQIDGLLNKSGSEKHYAFCFFTET